MIPPSPGMDPKITTSRFSHRCPRVPSPHRLVQQFADRTYQGINAVGRIPCCGAVDIGCNICHLVFELREGADVMDAALLVERRHRFGRTTLPREARAAVNATFGSTMRSV